MKINLILILLFSLTSCATIRHGKYQNVAFNSEPCGANVWVNQQLMGTTPALVTLNRDKAYTVKIELDGYKPYNAQLHPTLSGWVFGNILFGGVVGVAVDAVTGSMYKLEPNQLNACLASDESRVIAHMKQAEDCQVMVVTQADPAWERIGELERA